MTELCPTDRLRPLQLVTLPLLETLSAMLVMSAIPPLFGFWHGGGKGTRHAYTSVNLLGGLVAAPLAGLLVDGVGLAPKLVLLLGLLAAFLLFAAADSPSTSQP